jgi:Subtilase family
MKTRIRAIAVLGLPAVVACCSLPSPTVATASTVSPLSPSNYTVRSVCAAPAPGYASCLALRLVARTPAARARTHPLGMTSSAKIGVKKASECHAAYAASCFAPQALRDAYFPGEQPDAPISQPQTIALIDAYNDPNAEADLEVYDQEFGLPPCTKANGCFKKVNQNGQTAPLPSAIGKEAGEWALETSTDIEVAHAVCQNCRILLIETNSAAYPDLEAAEEAAVGLSAAEISNSWGGPEVGEDSKAFNHPGVVITAAAGDNGYLNWAAENEEERGSSDYPASSPHVVAVGGTRLTLNAGVWASETTWNDGGKNAQGEIEGAGAGGGGCSASFTAPSWQQSLSDWSALGCGTNRAVADISADGDPYTGVAIYDSVPYPEGPGTTTVLDWAPIGGTSVASPIISSVFALGGGAYGVEYPARTLYENEIKTPGSLHDVISGSNGECSKPFDEKTGTSGCSELQEAASCSARPICLAQKGYDGPTGVGTPNGIAAFQPPIAKEVEKASEGVPPGAPPAVIPVSVTSPGGVASPGSTTSSSPGLAVQPTIRLSAFALTPNALIALRRVRPKTSSVGFAFTLSAAARVRATLARRVRVRGHLQWRLVPGALTFTAIKGRNHRRLANRNALIPGRYHLTLTPQHGSARSIVFQVA